MGVGQSTDLFFQTAAWSGLFYNAADDANAHGAHVLFVTSCCIKLGGKRACGQTRTTRRTSWF